MFFEKVFGDLRRCRRCLLPETFPGIDFDEDGVCNYCRDYKKVQVDAAVDEYRERLLPKILKGKV